MNKTFPFFAVVSLFAFAFCNAQELTIAPSSTTRQSNKHSPDFENEIQPILIEFCADCHSPGDMPGLEFLADIAEAEVIKHRDLFAGVFEQMETRAMPPRGLDQPTDHERKSVTDWIKKTFDLQPSDYDRIAQYVVETFEDQKGNLWFGTMRKGAARYDGKTLTYFNVSHGLPTNAVTSFAEDKDGNLFVGTQAGICKFDGQKFERLGITEGLPAPSRPSPLAWSSVTADREGEIWARVGKGLYRSTGRTFEKFDLPIDIEEIESYAIVPGSSSFQFEDENGNLWFATDGNGAFKFDGKSFRHFTKEDGLCSNNVNSIMQDRQGNIWFACMQSFQPKMTGDGGLCKFDGKTITQFPDVKGLSENDIYTIFESRSGEIWVGASGVGAYRFDGENFTLFDNTDKPHWTRNFGVQSITEDRNGTLWFGFSGGLFRFNGKSFYSVTKEGPWEGLAKSMANALTGEVIDSRMIHQEAKIALSAMANNDFEHAKTVMEKLRTEAPNEPSVQEDTINLMGYHLVWTDKLELATKVFKLNTRLYPTRYNTFDSLADVYQRRGNEQLAVVNYKKSIELNPENITAENSIRVIGARHKYENVLVAPEDWLEEVLVVPTTFAPEMSLTGMEHLRLPPEFRDPDSDWFISYLFLIDLTEPNNELNETLIAEQLLIYFRGLASGGSDQDGKKIDTDKFSIASRKLETGQADGEFIYQLNWQEPFAKGTPLKQNLRVKIVSGKNEHGILFITGSPQPFESDVWTKLLGQ